MKSEMYTKIFIKIDWQEAYNLNSSEKKGGGKD